MAAHRRELSDLLTRTQRSDRGAPSPAGYDIASELSPLCSCQARPTACEAVALTRRWVIVRAWVLVNAPDPLPTRPQGRSLRASQDLRHAGRRSVGPQRAGGPPRELRGFVPSCAEAGSMVGTPVVPAGSAQRMPALERDTPVTMRPGSTVSTSRSPSGTSARGCAVPERWLVATPPDRALAPGIVEAVQLYMTASQAPNTVRAYGSDMRDFEAWCRAHSQQPLPATPQTVAVLAVLRRSAHSSTLLPRL